MEDLVAEILSKIKDSLILKEEILEEEEDLFKKTNHFNKLFLLLNVNHLVTVVVVHHLVTSVIVQVHKKGDKQIADLPVSLLPIFSKVFEILFFNSIFEYLQENGLLYDNQSGFWHFGLCEYQLLYLL